MNQNILEERSLDFAAAVILMCDSLKGHASLRDQLIRSAASIGANIREARYAHGRADFIAKLQIALKECYESEYWLELFLRVQLADETQLTPLKHDCGVIRKMLISSLTTAKGNDK